MRRDGTLRCGGTTGGASLQLGRCADQSFAMGLRGAVPRHAGRRCARFGKATVALLGNAACAPLGLDDGRRRDDGESLPCRLVHSTKRATPCCQRESGGGYVRMVSNGWHIWWRGPG